MVCRRRRRRRLSKIRMSTFVVQGLWVSLNQADVPRLAVLGLAKNWKFERAPRYQSRKVSGQKEHQELLHGRLYIGSSTAFFCI